MGKKLYVGNMSYSTTEQALKDAFAAYGDVTSVDIITDRMTGRPRGFAFVEMATEEAAQAAIAGMNGEELDGRALTVNEARPRDDSGRGRGGYGGGGGQRRDQRRGGGGDRQRGPRRDY